MEKTEQKLHILKDGEKYCFADEQGNIVIPCTWKEVGDFQEGLAPVCNDEDKWGYIDMEGNIVIPCEWRDAKLFGSGFAEVFSFTDNDFSYYIDTKGDVICSSVFSYQEVENILESMKLAEQSKYKEAIEMIFRYAAQDIEDTSPLNLIITYSLKSGQYEDMEKLLDSFRPLDIFYNYTTKLRVGDVYRNVLKDYVKAYLWYESAEESQDDVIRSEAYSKKKELLNEHPEIKEDSRVDFDNVTYEDDFD